MIYFGKRKNLKICILSDNKLHVVSDDEKKCSVAYEDLKDIWKAIDTNSVVWKYKRDCNGNYVIAD